MSSIIVKLKILPKNPEIKINDLVKSIKEKLPQNMYVKKEEEEPIAFGIIASILIIQIEEKEGSMDVLEESVRSSPLVSQIDIIGISRASTKIS